MNYQGSRSRRGTEVHAIISTLVESAKRCGVPPEAYLFAAAEHAMEKAGNVLLPDEFKRFTKRSSSFDSSTSGTQDGTLTTRTSS